MKKVLILFACIGFLSMQVFAQRTVTGTVTSAEDGSALPGVSVLVKGTQVGTISDMDGKYSVNVPEGANALIFEFMGLLTQEVPITGDVVSVSMVASDITIDDVVVTALGITREKKSVGYAIQDLKGDELSKTRESNFINSLSGKISGVTITNSSGGVGASSRIVIRGVNSLSGNNQPLFVVDGIPVSNRDLGDVGTDGVNRGNAAADVDPNDIESISVLKGSNAAALYGSRASNGVILITTKSGSQKKGFGIEVSNFTTMENPLKLPDFQNSYGQGAGGRFSFVDGAGGGINDGTDESWGPKLDIGLMIPQYNSPVNSDGTRQATPWISHPDNVKDFFETGVTTNTSVSITGGGQNTTFRTSYSQQDQKGMVPNTDFHKKTLSVNASTKPIEKMEVSVGANYVNSQSDNQPGYGYSAQNVMQQFMWFGRQVDIPNLTNYTDKELGFTDDYGTKYNWNYNYHNNPYFTLHENLNPMDRNRLFGNFKLTYQLFDWMRLMVRTGGDLFTNTISGRIARKDNDNPEGSFFQTIQNFKEINSDFLITINRDLSEDFTLGLNLGGNRMDQSFSDEFGSADELSLGGIYTIGNSKVPIRSTNKNEQKRINSLYFAGSLSYKDAIYFDFTGRNDWSSTLPDGKNSYFYPSASLSVILTQLLGIESPTLSFAKLRGGWSKVGSDTDPYKLKNTVEFGDGWNAGTKLPNLFVPNTIQNSELEPQFVTSTEIGGEFRFFNNRLSLDAAYYTSKAKGQILTVPISTASGFDNKIVNAGTLENNGVEISISGVPLKIAGFQWDVTLNWSKNNNKLTDLPEGIENYQIGTYWSLKVLAEKDKPYGSLFGYDFARDAAGNIIHENGLPLQGDLKTLGNYQADWVAGLNNELTYKNFSLSFLIDMKKGGDIYSMTTTWGRYAGVLEETLQGREDGIVGNGVMEDPANPGRYIPNTYVASCEEYNKAAYSNTLAGGSVFDGTYVKLREIRFGYVIHKIGNFPIRDIGISLVGRNLAILYSTVPHIDPETSFSNSNVQGLEFGQLPSTRSLGFNINFKF